MYYLIDLILPIIMVVVIFLSLSLVQYENMSSSVIGAISVAITAFFILLRFYIRSLKLKEMDKPQFEKFARDYFTNMIETTSFLKIMDNTGGRVNYKKHKLLKSNQNMLKEYKEVGIYFDGHIEDFEINQECKRHNFTKNYMNLTVKFDPPLMKGETKAIDVSWTFIDCFTNSQEFFTTHFHFPTQEYTLIIDFPKDRPYKSASVKIEPPGTKLFPLSQHFIDTTDNKRIEFKIFHVPPDTKTIVFWEW